MAGKVAGWSLASSYNRPACPGNPGSEKLVLIDRGARIATATDVRSRRIPNVLTFGAMGAGLGLGICALDGARAVWLGNAIAGVAAGFALLLLLPYAIGAVKAGDVKLLMAFGALARAMARALDLSLWVSRWWTSLRGCARGDPNGQAKSCKLLDSIGKFRIHSGSGPVEAARACQ